MSVAGRLAAVRSTLPEGVTLVAVSKFHPVEALREAYDAGQRIFAESRVQELLPKTQAMPADVCWHFIGHLQRNKAKMVVGCADLIESVDSLALLALIDRLAAERGIVQRVLLEAHVAAEEAKSGFDPAELLGWFAGGGYRELRATHICGIMGMATNTDDAARIDADFAALATLLRDIHAAAPDLRGCDILSMGMSHDYPAAIAHGATHVRVGTAIFGERQ
ncbi:MAG: YggS family pyridoxal phosphate-dependent enzyme [Muribaculaceae bacterium]|nr:YggS family pyridoxal phosphate-dependent enzyme [Muribaculaceae bacterium]MCI9117513.1 YggS family pyridoxal phosphate-dependent enzyme [Muribaculaceae bacterium]